MGILWDVGDERGNVQRVHLRAFAGWILVAAIVLLSVLVVLVLSESHRRSERENREAEVHRVATALDAVTALSVAQLHATATFLELHPNLTQPQFRRLSAALLPDHPVIAVSFIQVDGLPNAERWETGLQGPSDWHQQFPVRLSSSSGPEGQLLPADQVSAARMFHVVRRAHVSDAAAVTLATSLKGSDDRHLVIFHPVRHTPKGAAPKQPSEPLGFAAGVIRVSELLASAEAVVPSGTELALVEENGEVLSDHDQLEDFVSTPIVIADRSWELRMVVPAREIWMLPLLLGLGGLLLAATIGLLLLNWSRRERNALELAHVRVEERNRAMKAEAQTNRMYRLLAENLSDMVLVADPDARITYVSPAGERMLGWTPREMIGLPVLGFLHPDDAPDSSERFSALRHGAGILTFEHRLRCSDDSYIWVESAIRSIHDPETGLIVEFQAATRDISERKPLQEQLERLAREDPLTGLSNRRQFAEMLDSELARAQRSGLGGALMLIDIDHFKQVNDSYGHLAGDRVLRRVAQVMRSRMRISDTRARLGGDEFAAILPEADEDEGVVVAEAVVRGVAETLAQEPELPDVTVSIGIANFASDEPLTSDEIFERADTALYRAKAEGRDRVVTFRPELRNAR